MIKACEHLSPRSIGLLPDILPSTFLVFVSYLYVGTRARMKGNSASLQSFAMGGFIVSWKYTHLLLHICFPRSRYVLYWVSLQHESFVLLAETHTGLRILLRVIVILCSFMFFSLYFCVMERSQS